MFISLLAGWVCTPAVWGEKVRFYSSKASAAFKSRTEEISPGTGRSSLTRAKSMSGVGAVLYPSVAPSLDSATSKKLLELFDKKKNWMFQDLDRKEESVESMEQWLGGNDPLGDEMGGRRKAFFQSRGVVGHFIQSGDRKEKSRKKTNRRGQLEPLPGQEEEDDLAKSDFELNRDEFKEGVMEKKHPQFLARSPFAGKTALADFSPFSRKSSKSKDPFKTLRNRAVRSGSRPEPGQTVGRTQVGFFHKQNKAVGGVFNKAEGKTAKRPLGLDPMSFGTGLVPQPTTPVTGVSLGGRESAFKLPTGLGAPTSVPRPWTSSLKMPSVPVRRQSPLLFQSREWQPPATRSGLLQQKPASSGSSPHRGF